MKVIDVEKAIDIVWDKAELYPFEYEAIKLAMNKEAFDIVKHGHWIFNKDLIAHLQCSECGLHVQWMNAKRPNYCPNCGARMDEVKNNGKA